jgi:UDP-galactopyranose mutase
MNIENYDYLIVGCGLSGCVLAERITNILKKKVLIIDKRDHIGGNCYDYIHESGIRINKYGAHIFHTNNEKVWEYIQKFAEWKRYEHKVLSYVDNIYVPIPVNITTINLLCNENLKTENDAEKWLLKNQIKYKNIYNSEEIAKSRIGNILYEKLIKYYTFKQWAKYPKDLDKCVLERIPIRKNFDDRYFDDKYQALPSNGYTDFFKNILNNELIDIKLNIDFFQFKSEYDINRLKIIYTGPIDFYYSNLGFEKLEYRSIDFDVKHIKNMNYYQPNSVVNHNDMKEKYTRIIEYKHFLNQKSNDTVIVSETTNDHGEPFYPVLNKKNIELYEKYKNFAKKEKNVLFVGRLANFKYFNMDQTIENALNIFDKEINL